ncbi:MAG: TonB-dependent receptor [Prevotella sp.]|nr:TonB-dependent receptor [Prevotella sp.]
MRKSLFLGMLLMAVTALQAQRVTRSYNHMPLPRVLTDLDNSSRQYTINFIYNELEDFTVTADIRSRTIPEAVREALGFYPMRMAVGDSLIFVECTQKTPAKVIGHVVDQHNRPVPFANVALLNPSDSSFVNGGVTNDGGDFVIPCTRQRILLRVSFVGFGTYYKLVSVGHLGTIRMKPDPYTLKGVTVKGNRRVVKNAVDRLQYLVNNDPYTKGMNGIEVMARVPMLNVSDENVAIVGKGSTHIMLDGHILEVSSEAVKAKLRSLKAEDIERVEVITIPPAKYKAEANAGYINIVMKRDQSKGWSGDVTMEVQRQYKWTTRPAVNLNYASRKFEMTASGNMSLGYVYNRQTSVYDFNDGHQRTSDRVSSIYWPMYGASVIMKYHASPRLDIGLMANLDADRMRIDQTDMTIEQDTTRTTTHQPATFNSNISTTLYADYQLDSLGKTMSLNYNFFSGHDPVVNENTSVTNGISESLRSQSHNLYQIHALKLDFALPFKSVTLETGVSYSYMTNKTGITIHNLIGSDWQKNTNESNDFNYYEQNLAAYVSARKELTKRLQAQVGLRYEYTLTKGRQLTLGQTDRNHYGRFFPSVHVSWQPKDGHNIGLAMNCGIERPNFDDLNPWRLYTTVNSYTTGNPYLTAAYTRNSEVNYNNGKGLYLVLYNDHGHDEQAFNITFNADGGQVSQPVNGVSHDKTGLYATYNRSFFGWMSLQAEGEVYYHDARSDSRSSQAPMHGWGRRVSGKLSFLLNRAKTLNASVTFGREFSSYFDMRRTSPSSILYGSVSYSCLGDRLKLHLSGGDPFRWRVNHTTSRYTGFTAYNSFDGHARYISFRATWSFGGKRVKRVYHDNRDTESQRAK